LSINENRPKILFSVYLLNSAQNW